jgi:AAA+ ATPase superfamily predicted ATPase
MMKIKLETKVIELSELWFDYLFPYLVRFCISKAIGIEWKNDIIFISKENQNDFNKFLQVVLEELLRDCYKEPSQKERSKYSSRYQKIEFNDRIYILNYRTDIVGKVGYGINYLIQQTKVTDK